MLSMVHLAACNKNIKLLDHQTSRPPKSSTLQATQLPKVGPSPFFPLASLLRPTQSRLSTPPSPEKKKNALPPSKKPRDTKQHQRPTQITSFARPTRGRLGLGLVPPFGAISGRWAPTPLRPATETPRDFHGESRVPRSRAGIFQAPRLSR